MVLLTAVIDATVWLVPSRVKEFSTFLGSEAAPRISAVLEGSAPFTAVSRCPWSAISVKPLYELVVSKITDEKGWGPDRELTITRSELLLVPVIGPVTKIGAPTKVRTLPLLLIAPLNVNAPKLELSTTP